MSETTAPSNFLDESLPAEAIPASDSFRMSWRPLKLFTAGSLVFAGAYGVLSEQRYVSSTNAIVSAYVLDVRTPIDGIVTGLPHTPGAWVQSGDVLGHVDNPLVDHQHLDNLRTLEEVAQSTADADAVEAGTLQAQRGFLLGRARDHAKAVTARLIHSVAEAESNLQAVCILRTQAGLELERGKQLHAAGILPTADYDKLIAQEAVARQQVNAKRAELESFKGEMLSARHGLLSEPGTNNDVPYSRQRADELSTKLAETHRSLAAFRAQAREAHDSVQTETLRAKMLHSTDLHSPIDGRIWEIQAVDGERSTTGDSMLSLVDCGRQLLLVEVPQDRLPDIAVGQQARFRLSGESNERFGKVLAANGDPQKESNHKFAAFPVGDTSLQLATVRVAIEATPSASEAQRDSSGCAIGRTARVLLPTHPTNYASRIMRLYF